MHHCQKEINRRLTIGRRLFHAGRKTDCAAGAMCRMGGHDPSRRRVSESCATVVCCSSPRLTGWFQGEANRIGRCVPEAAGAVNPCSIDRAFMHRLR